MYGFLSTLENVLANSALRTGLGAVPFNGPAAPVVFDAQSKDPHDVVDVDPAHPLIALGHEPPPLPMGAPGPSLKIGVMILSAPAPGASTMPVRTTARRTPSDLDRARHVLAFPADDREKIVAGRARLGELFIALRAVEADRGPLNEDLGTGRGILDRGDQVLRAMDPAIADLALDLGVSSAR